MGHTENVTDVTEEENGSFILVLFGTLYYLT